MASDIKRLPKCMARAVQGAWWCALLLPRGLRRLSAGMVVCGLLVLEGLLLLVNEFAWRFSIVVKGWPVLMAVGAVTLVFILWLLAVLAGLIFRRRFQFSLRSLMLFVLPAAIAFGWFGREWRAAEEQRRFREMYGKTASFGSYSGFYFTWDPQPVWGYPPAFTFNAFALPESQWLCELFGEDFFKDVGRLDFTIYDAQSAGSSFGGALLHDAAHFRGLRSITLTGPGATIHGLRLLGFPMNGSFGLAEHGAYSDVGEDDLRHLVDLPRLGELEIVLPGARVSGTKHFKSMRQLKHLSLQFVTLQEHSLAPLTGHRALEALSLVGSKVSDAELKHVGEIPNLRYLALDLTGITDRGLKHLQGLSALRELSLVGTHITDSALETIGGLTTLETLILDGTAVSDAGLHNLSRLKNLRVLSLWQTNVRGSGFADLLDLSRLTQLNLCQTSIDDAGLRFIGQLASLTSLDLSQTKVTLNGLKNLKQHPVASDGSAIPLMLKFVDTPAAHEDYTARCNGSDLLSKFGNLCNNSFSFGGGEPAPSTYLSVRPVGSGAGF